MDSSINLVKSGPSVPMMLKLSWVVWCPASWMCSCIGHGPLRWSQYLSPQGPRCFSNIFLTTIYSWTLIAVDDSTLLFFWVLVLRLDLRSKEIPRLTTQCRTTLDPVIATTAKLLLPLEQDPVQDTLSSHIYRDWGKASSAHA